MHLRGETLKDAGNRIDTLTEAACIQELSVAWGLHCLDGISVLILENSPLQDLKIQCQKTEDTEEGHTMSENHANRCMSLNASIL